MQIAVIIPAFNEEQTIVNVIEEFKQVLSDAKIYVGNNNSQDKTAELAKEAGAEVIFCRKKGKGYTVRKLFDKINADIYIMVDADGTYSLSNIQEHIELVLRDKADMVIGVRKATSKKALSFSHWLGNKLLTSVLNRFFRVKLKDVLSGYRVISRKVVDDLILLAKGFELEVELTIRALQEGFTIIEMPVEYRQRPAGSISKLSTWEDGLLILYTVITLFRDYSPMIFFSVISLLFFCSGFVSGIDILIIFLKTGKMYHIGLAIFTALSILLSAIIFILGLLLDSFNKSWRLNQESMRRNRLLLNAINSNHSQNGNQ